MIPETLRNKFFNDLLPNGNTSTQTTHLRGQLCALVDMAYIDEEQRREIQERFAGRLHPLITEPGLEDFTPFSATLIQAPATDLEGQDSLIQSLERYNSDVVSVWITSTLTTLELAQHLRQATFAYGEEPSPSSNLYEPQKQQQRYLLRYYDPLITPTLYGQAPQEWQQWLFAPIINWWFAMANPRGEEWHQLVGGRNTQAQTLSAPKLILSQELKDALHYDGYPHVLLEALEKNTPELFTDNCKGVRLAQIRALLEQAQKYGINDKDNQSDFVYLGLKYTVSRVTHHPDWQAALRSAVSGQRRLIQTIRF